jgi:aminoglycoside phosphotransferase family enzyme
MEPKIRFPGEAPATLIQTHTSWVWLYGEEVLKVKKPVSFSFLDYGTLQRRRRFCELEVALNRRFSPEVYLGVVPLTEGEGGLLEIAGEGEPVEWAVRLRRLPDGAQLNERLSAGTVEATDLEALADVLGVFYGTAETDPEIAAFGSVEQVRENTVENFETTLDFPEDLLPDALRRRLREANERFLAGRRDLFAERVAAGRVLDGHGDLKPENVFLTPDGPVVTDCIEFNERFRYGDVLVDVGYLTMGLRAAGREDLREAFLARFTEVAEPDLPRELLAYYEAYRAVVKGKIEGYRALQPEVPEAEREEARRIARAHFELAGRIVDETGV